MFTLKFKIIVIIFHVQKLNEKTNERYSKLTDEEKKEKLVDWLERKRRDKEKLEKQLKVVMEENKKKVN